MPKHIIVKRSLAKHGKSKTRVYKAWRMMKYRCLNKNCADYKAYGGRGIKICDRWLKSFEAFLEDMGEPGQGLSLDRKDVDGDYCLQNCRWATIDQQQKNKRNTIKLEIGGVERHFSEWCHFYGVNYQTAYARLFIRGLSLDQVFSRTKLFRF